MVATGVARASLLITILTSYLLSWLNIQAGNPCFVQLVPEFHLFCATVSYFAPSTKAWLVQRTDLSLAGTF